MVPHTATNERLNGAAAGGLWAEFQGDAEGGTICSGYLGALLCHPVGAAPGQEQPTWRFGPGLGVSDSGTLTGGWDGIQEERLGLVYNNACCLQ